MYVLAQYTSSEVMQAENVMLPSKLFENDQEIKKKQVTKKCHSYRGQTNPPHRYEYCDLLSLAGYWVTLGLNRRLA